MIPYSVNAWGFCWKMFSFKGSVFPQALVWAIPTSAMSVAMWYYVNHVSGDITPQNIRKDAATQVLTGFTSVLGFLLIFRTQKAYGRYWECAMYLQKARGEWFNATSNLVSFCSPNPEKADDCRGFQQKLVRLISLLFCSAIGEVCTMRDPNFEVIDTLMDDDSAEYLQSKVDRCEIVMQWIQRLVVDSIRTNTIDIAPPIVSRVFQEFSMGIVNIAAAKKITIIPFPFPYAQMMQFLLIFQACLVPVISGYSVAKWWVAFLQTFVIVFLTWCIHFIAMEIEMPFGDDANDLPLSELITNMNDSLFNLVDKQAQDVPRFGITAEVKSRGLVIEDRVAWSAKCRIPSKRMSKVSSDAHHTPSFHVGATATRTQGDPVKASASPSPVAVTIPDAKPPSLSPTHATTTSPASQPITQTASPQTLSGDTAARLAQISASIEGHLSQIGEGFCPRVEQRLDRMGSELQQIANHSHRFMERTERFDKANMGSPINGVTDPSHLWFCGERQAAELTAMEEAQLGPKSPRTAPYSRLPALGRTHE